MYWVSTGVYYKATIWEICGSVGVKKLVEGSMGLNVILTMPGIEQDVLLSKSG